MKLPELIPGDIVTMIRDIPDGRVVTIRRVFSGPICDEGAEGYEAFLLRAFVNEGRTGRGIILDEGIALSRNYIEPRLLDRVGHVPLPPVMIWKTGDGEGSP